MERNSELITRTYAIYPTHDAIVKAIAEKEYHGNDSAAARRVIEYAAVNLLPLLGIARPAALSQETPA